MEKDESIRNKAEEINDKLGQISEKLGLLDKQQIISIDFKENIKLGGTLERNNIFLVKIRDKNGQISHIVIDTNINKIANINKDGKIELSDEEIKKWQQFIGTKEFQNAEQKKKYDFSQEYYLEEYKINEKTKEDESRTGQTLAQSDCNNTQENAQNNKNVTMDKQNKEEQNAKEALKVDETAVIAIIKIEDRKTFGQAINKKLDADAYIVKYGNNKTKLMQGTSEGKLKEVSGIEYNDFNLEVLQQLNLDKPRQNLRIKAGDLTTIKTEDNKYNYVVVREKDSKKGVVIVNSNNETRMYNFDDEGKDNLREIELSIRYEVEKDEQNDNDKQINTSKKTTGEIDDNNENEGERVKTEEKENEDEDEQRTPWADAYKRMKR